MLKKSDFLALHRQFFPNGKADSLCSLRFKAFDINKSGTIDFREYMLAMYITSKGKPEQKLKWAFNVYDIDGNGTIEFSEMKR